MSKIIDAIGLPAMLEQLAEECTELAHASLEYARKLRGENPTTKTIQEIDDAITEEASDVMMCLHILLDNNIGGDWRISEANEKRWETSLKEAGKL